ncbi:MAG: TolC family protein [Magnetococcales bacterium]|nr:TolC family protein [Magnetococcales bacterium]
MAFILTGCSISPTPITLEEKKRLMAADQKLLFENQELPKSSITIHEAMARAIKYNMEHRLKVMESALSQKQLDISNLAMLPSLTTTGTYKNRSNSTASTSESSTASSISTDKYGTTSDLTLSWNILDFGVSYYQAKQDADRILIAEQRRRKVLHNLMRDVRYAFWKAYSAQNLEPYIKRILKDTKDALVLANQAEKEGLPSHVEALQYQRMLLETLRQMQNLQRELVLARAELAKLMNIAPVTPFTLFAGNNDLQKIPRLNIPVQQMEQIALMNLPELWEENYQNRISVAETKKAIASLLPGLSINTAWNSDSNSYLVNQNWLSVNSSITWNLMNIFSGKKKLQLAKAQESIAQARRLSLSMAALSQVHTAYQNYRLLINQMEQVRKLDNIDRRLHKHTINKQQSNLLGRLERIQSAVQALTTRVQKNQTYAELQNAFGMINFSLGMDPLPPKAHVYELEGLTNAIAIASNRWESGYFVPASSLLPNEKPGVETIDHIPPLKALKPIVLVHQAPPVANGYTKFINASKTEFEKPLLSYPLPHKEKNGNKKKETINRVKDRIMEWAAAWSTRNVKQYLDFYSNEFLLPKAYTDRSQWEKQRSHTITKANLIWIKLDNIQVNMLNPDMAQTTFSQLYTSPGFHSIVDKTLLLVLEEGGWNIVWECTKGCNVQKAIEKMTVNDS